MFFDTNVLVRARFEAAPGHRLARLRMSEAGERRETLRISLTFDARGFRRYERRIEPVDAGAVE